MSTLQSPRVSSPEPRSAGSSVSQPGQSLIFPPQIGLVKGLLYVVAQCVGAIVGAAVLSILIPGEAGASGLSGINAGQGFGIEFIITLVLVLVVFAAAADGNNSDSVRGSAPLAIGLSITTCHLFAIPLTGSSMNPARTLGPSVIFNSWANHWVYWVGPILGGVTAALIYQLVLKVRLGERLGRNYNYNVLLAQAPEKTKYDGVARNEV